MCIAVLCCRGPLKEGRGSLGSLFQPVGLLLATVISLSLTICLRRLVLVVKTVETSSLAFLWLQCLSASWPSMTLALTLVSIQFSWTLQFTGLYLMLFSSNLIQFDFSSVHFSSVTHARCQQKTKIQGNSLRKSKQWNTLTFYFSQLVLKICMQVCFVSINLSCF